MERLRPRAREKMKMSKTNKQNKRGKYCRTADHRRLMGELILKWKPWLKSTGPKTTLGKAQICQNAFKGGARQEVKKLRDLLKEQVRTLKGIQ
jgi:hypothetical protein